MDPLIGGALIGAGINAIGGMIGSGLDYKESKKLMNHQHSLALQDWERQNAYNTPTAQMQRLKDAGLNPYLMYGQGTTGVSSSSVQQPQFSKIDKYSRMSDSISRSIEQVMAVKMQKATMDNMKAQNNLLKAQVQMEQEKIANMRVDTNRKQFDLNFAQDVRSYEYDIRKSAATNARQQIVATLVDIGVNTERARNIAANTANTLLSQENIKLQAQEIKQRILESKSRITLNNVQCQNLYSMMAYRALQGALVEAQTTGVNNQNSIFNLVETKMKLENYKLTQAIDANDLDNFYKDLRNAYYDQFGTTSPGGAFGGAAGLISGAVGGEDSRVYTPRYFDYNR